MVKHGGLLIAMALVGAALNAVPANAATTINFETTAGGSPTVAGTAVNFDFAPLGLTFSDAFYKACGGGCPAPELGTFISSSDFSSPFTALFSGVTDAFGFENVSQSAGTASAFGADGTLLQTINFSDFPASYSFGVTGIHSVQFSSVSEFGVDNFSFSDVSGAVPEPSTWAMMLFGFGVIGFGLRRSRVAPSALLTA